MGRNILGGLFVVFAVLFAAKSFAQDQKAIDDKILTDYFAKNKIKATKTPSGLYYVILKKGNGEKPKAGEQVHVNYLGKFLDGTRFDGNIDDKWVSNRQELVFAVGTGQVIKGWDEGLMLLNPGTRAALYIPSGLAYGPAGRSIVKPNSILMFNVELLSVDK